MNTSPTPRMTPWSLPARPPWPPSSDLVRDEHRFSAKGQRFQCRKKTAIKKGTPSWIWQYGTEARTEGDSKPHWLCNQCWDKRQIVLHRIGTTHYSIEHLKVSHLLSEDGPIDVPQQIPIFPEGQAPKKVANLVAQVDLDALKAALLRWICLAHIALSCVEVESFRALLLLPNPAVFAFLAVAGNTIRHWIILDYEERKERIHNALESSLSKIHISFDLWTSPNSLPMCGVVAHWLAPDLTSKSMLIGLRRVVWGQSLEKSRRWRMAVAGEWQSLENGRRWRNVGAREK